MITLFLIFKDDDTVFHCSCTFLSPHQQYSRILTSPHPCQPLLFTFLKTIAVILMDVKGCLNQISLKVMLWFSDNTLVMSLHYYLQKSESAAPPQYTKPLKSRLGWELSYETSPVEQVTSPKGYLLCCIKSAHR